MITGFLILRNDTEDSYQTRIQEITKATFWKLNFHKFGNDVRICLHLRNAIKQILF